MCNTGTLDIGSKHRTCGAMLSSCHMAWVGKIRYRQPRHIQHFNLVHSGYGAQGGLNVLLGALVGYPGVDQRWGSLLGAQAHELPGRGRRVRPYHLQAWEVTSFLPNLLGGTWGHTTKTYDVKK